MTPKRVVLVEDHPSFRDALVTVLESSEEVEVVATVSSAEELWAILDWRRPDLVLCDVHLPVTSGVEICRRLCAMPDGPRVCMLSADLKRDTIATVTAFGVAGYVHKSSPAPTIRALVEQAARGETAFDEAALRALDGEVNPARRPNAMLDDRDLAVLAALADGHTGADVARMLGEDTDDVDAHIDRLQLQVGAATPSALVAWALRERIIS